MNTISRLPPAYVIQAVNTLRDGLENLRKKLAPPSVVMLELVSGYFAPQAVFVATQLGIADLLKDGPKTVAELARSSGANAGALYRLLRACASVGVFKELSDGCFDLTPLAKTLQTGVPNSMREMVLLNGSPVLWRTWGELSHSVRTGEAVFPQLFGAGLFEYFAQNREEGEVFDRAMMNFSELAGVGLVNAYRFEGVHKIVDVGGGSGMLLALVLRANPTLTGVLFDLPHVVAGAPALLNRQGVAERCQIVGGSFFESIPPDGDAYLLKNIIHDWDDERATRILKTCSSAMPARAKLLIFDMVIPPGNGPFFGKFLDLAELLYETGGKERTADEFRTLLAGAGFRLMRIIPTASPLSVLEAVRV
jgi:hypothetical protein